METEPLSNTSKPSPIVSWRAIWGAAAAAGTASVLSFNWGLLPGPSLPQKVADALADVALSFFVWLLGAAGLFGIISTFLLALAVDLPRSRSSLLRWAALLGLSSLAVVLGAGIRSATSDTTTRRWVAWRARPVIRALEEYRADNGCYPRDLSSLRPRYLRKIPTPALLGSDRFQYETASYEDSEFSPPRGSYDLYLDLRYLLPVPFRVTLHYRPDKKYPTKTVGRALVWRWEKIGDWAYASLYSD